MVSKQGRKAHLCPTKAPALSPVRQSIKHNTVVFSLSSELLTSSGELPSRYEHQRNAILYRLKKHLRDAEGTGAALKALNKLTPAEWAKLGVPIGLRNRLLDAASTAPAGQDLLEHPLWQKSLSGSQLGGDDHLHSTAARSLDGGGGGQAASRGLEASAEDGVRPLGSRGFGDITEDALTAYTSAQLPTTSGVLPLHGDKDSCIPSLADLPAYLCVGFRTEHGKLRLRAREQCSSKWHSEYGMLVLESAWGILPGGQVAMCSAPLIFPLFFVTTRVASAQEMTAEFTSGPYPARCRELHELRVQCSKMLLDAAFSLSPSSSTPASATGFSTSMDWAKGYNDKIKASALAPRYAMAAHAMDGTFIDRKMDHVQTPVAMPGLVYMEEDVEEDEILWDFFVNGTNEQHGGSDTTCYATYEIPLASYACQDMDGTGFSFADMFCKPADPSPSQQCTIARGVYLLARTLAIQCVDSACKENGKSGPHLEAKSVLTMLYQHCFFNLNRLTSPDPKRACKDCFCQLPKNGIGELVRQALSAEERVYLAGLPADRLLADVATLVSEFGGKDLAIAEPGVGATPMATGRAEERLSALLKSRLRLKDAERAAAVASVCAMLARGLRQGGHPERFGPEISGWAKVVLEEAYEEPTGDAGPVNTSGKVLPLRIVHVKDKDKVVTVPLIIIECRHSAHPICRLASCGEDWDAFTKTDGMVLLAKMQALPAN